MSTLATWSHVVQSRDVSPHNFDGLAMSGLAFSVAPTQTMPSGIHVLKVKNYSRLVKTSLKR